MPLLGIAIPQPCSCFQTNIIFGSGTQFQSRTAGRNDRGLGLASTFSWGTFYITKRVGKNLSFGRNEVWRGGLMIKAVVTLEVTSVNRKNEGVNGYQNALRMNSDSPRSNHSVFEPQSLNEDPAGADSREKLRRMRISQANKGNTPWNKGRKHSPETLQRIKERTRLAMQDPKVKMKLANLGHGQSEETRLKIGVGVRLGWERRREKLMLQESCYHEWQNLIAVAARKGLLGQEEYQWDSYKILGKQLEQEWLRSVEQRKHTPKPKGSRRAPKSAEQKRKISEAIAAKWADPGYRDRVCSGLAKFHGTPEGVERKPSRKPSGESETKKRSHKKKDETDDPTKRKDMADNCMKQDTKSTIERTKSKRSRRPSYKDPLASSKLEMLKSIRAQRAAAVNKNCEAVTRAKLLIAEAQKAAEALEIAAQSSPVAQASLVESRMLIREAIQVIETIENRDMISLDNENDISLAGEEKDADAKNLELPEQRKVNGVHSLSAIDIEAEDFSFKKFALADLLNGDATGSSYIDILQTDEKLYERSPNGFHSLELGDMGSFSDFTLNLTDPKPNFDGTSSVNAQRLSVNGLEFDSESVEAAKKQQKITMKWIRGRLVEVAEEK